MLTQQQPQIKQPRDAEILIYNKNISFLWLVLATQLFYSLMYGFFISVNSSLISTSEEFVHTALLLVLIIGGFGLAFAYPARMLWSSLGINLLITALSILTFFLVNAFWIKSKVYLGTSEFNTAPYTVALTPSELGAPETGANLNEAIKASLACIVAYSFIKGRTGLLEAYFIALLGTVLYELTRQVCLNNFPYEVGSIKIFFFGAMIGNFASLLISRLGNEANYEKHQMLYENKKSWIVNLLGLLICWALFPLLARDAEITEVASTKLGRVFTIVLAMSAAALLSIFIAGFKYGFRLVINSTIGAGVAILSSSAYISNPVYGILFGLVSALFQLLFHFIYQHFQMKVDPNRFVFLGQGFLGIFYQTINRRIVQLWSNNLTFTFTTNRRPEHILGIGAITGGIALITGFVLGTLLSCCSYHEEIDHYHDFTYWVDSDGLRYADRDKELVVKKIREEQEEDDKEEEEYLCVLKAKNANL